MCRGVPWHVATTFREWSWHVVTPSRRPNDVDTEIFRQIFRSTRVGWCVEQRRYAYVHALGSVSLSFVFQFRRMLRSTTLMSHPRCSPIYDFFCAPHENFPRLFQRMRNEVGVV